MFVRFEALCVVRSVVSFLSQPGHGAGELADILHFVLPAEIRVDLQGGGNIGVAEDVLRGIEIHAGLVEERGRAVPEIVSADRSVAFFVQPAVLRAII